MFLLAGEILFNITLQILRSFAVVLFDSQHPMKLALGAPISCLQNLGWNPGC